MTTTNIELETHPYADIFPPLDERSLKLLSENIRQNGLLNPIVLLDGKILDGRNRYLACQLAGVEPTFTDYHSETDPIVWVLAQNSARRDLTASQRACIAVEADGLVNQLIKDAKERQKQGKQKIADPKTKGTAIEKLAQFFSTNRQYITDAGKIREKAPQRFLDIKAGKISIPAVLQELHWRETGERKPSKWDNVDGPTSAGPDYGAEPEGDDDTSPDPEPERKSPARPHDPQWEKRRKELEAPLRESNLYPTISKTPSGIYRVSITFQSTKEVEDFTTMVRRAVVNQQTEWDVKSAGERAMRKLWAQANPAAAKALPKKQRTEAAIKWYSELTR